MNLNNVVAALRKVVASAGWKTTYNPNDLRDAISYLFAKDSQTKAKEDVTLKGYRTVSDLKELDPRGLFYSFEAKDKGWGNKLPEEDFIAELEDDMQRPGFFAWVKDEHSKGQLAPLITINGQIGDGLGRAMFFHAIGQDVKVAEFETKYDLDSALLLRGGKPMNHLIAALREVITSSAKIKSKLPSYQKLIVESFVAFLMEKYAVTENVEINIGKPTKKQQFGSIDLGSFIKGRYKIKVSAALTTSLMLSYIGHEFMHLVQYLRNDLQVDLETKQILWQGKPFMNIEDYGKVTQYAEYAKIPWEAEAIQTGKDLVKEFENSKQMDELKASDDPSIKYLVKNDMLLL